MTGVTVLGGTAIFKALADETRYAIYTRLSSAAEPLSTAELARDLGLHPNTVRPHLERMRDVGLVELQLDTAGTVGRPQHLYSLVPGGLEQAVARTKGEADAAHYADAPSALEALVGELDRLGFDPAVSDGPGESAVVHFDACPFRTAAEAHPDLVCAMHRGLVEGFVEAMGDAVVTEFCTLEHRTPCRATIAAR